MGHRFISGESRGDGEYYPLVRRRAIAIHSGVVNIPSGDKTLIYETPNGVETCITMSIGPSGVHLGDSTVSSTSFFYSGSQLVTVSNFTGSVYGWISGVSTTVSFLAGDIS